MISYKKGCLREAESLRSKDGQRLSNLWKIVYKYCGNFKNNVPQRQIAKALQISSYAVHNILKQFRETGEISVHQGQGRRLCWMPVVFGPSDNTASIIGTILLLILLNGPRNTSRNHSR